MSLREGKSEATPVAAVATLSSFVQFNIDQLLHRFSVILLERQKAKTKN